MVEGGEGWRLGGIWVHGFLCDYEQCRFRAMLLYIMVSNNTQIYTFYIRVYSIWFESKMVVRLED
jgi:hypothetical protein